jgi:hypothetical protein
MTHTYFVPTHAKQLAEYFSSGFIGYVLSLDAEDDLQSLSFPQLCVVNALTAVKAPIFLEVNSRLASKAAPKALQPYALLAGPVSIASIQRVHFATAAEKTNFLASFSMMPDLPLDLFTLQHSEMNHEVAVDSLDLTTLPKIRQAKSPSPLSRTPGHLASLVVAIREAVFQFNEDIDVQLSCKVKPLNRVEACKKVVNALLEAIGALAVTPDNSFKFLFGYLQAVEHLSEHKTITAQQIIDAVSQQIKAEPKDAASGVLKILEKSKNILLGMEERKDLNDDQNALVLQRAVYLACTLDNVAMLDVVKKNIKISNVIESLARLLLLFRSRLSHIDGNLWRQDRAQLDAVLGATEQILATNHLQLDVIKAPHLKELDIQQQIVMNKVVIADRNIALPHEIQLIVSNLKTLDYEIRLSPQSQVLIDVRNEQGTPVEVGISLSFFAGQQQQVNYKMAVTVDKGQCLLKRKDLREALFNICQTFMVALDLDDSDHQILRFVRYQYSETMDRAELAHHLDLLANVWAPVTALVNKQKPAVKK